MQGGRGEGGSRLPEVLPLGVLGTRVFARRIAFESDALHTQQRLSHKEFAEGHYEVVICDSPTPIHKTNVSLA